MKNIILLFFFALAFVPHVTVHHTPSALKGKNSEEPEIKPQRALVPAIIFYAAGAK